MTISWPQFLRLSGAFILCLSCAAQSQPWPYDFGSGTGTHSTGASTNFLPMPQSGTARVRIGSQGGAIELRNPGDSRIGNASEAVLIAPTGSSLNKIQWYDFNGTRLFTLQVMMSISGGNGDLYFFCGNGSCFSDNVGFSSSQVFSGLRWVRDSSGLSLAVRSNGWTPVASSPMLADSVHMLEVYANNSNIVNGYNRGSSFTVAPCTYDIWVDGNLLLDDQTGAGMPDSLDIDSFMFYSSSNPSNDCTLTLDDIIYTNVLSAQPLPVELSAFEAHRLDQLVRLRWKTETEVQNFGFEIQRCQGNGQWSTLGFVPGDGDRQTPRWYAWTDSSTASHDTLRYRLRQIDRDGSSTFSPVRNVEGAPQTEGLQLGAPWPNPASDVIFLPISTLRECVVHLEITSLTGIQVAVLPSVLLLPSGGQDLRLSCANWPRGMHLLTVYSSIEVRSCMLLLI
ncbi:MAG: hypothetical protein WBQ23_16375 [Bacteroidota bacterium]